MNEQCFNQMETIEQICYANQSNGFYMMETLTYFMPLVSFYTPWKHQKTRDHYTKNEVFR